MVRQRVEPGREFVWNSPRPPRLEDSDKRIEVVFGGPMLARMDLARWVLETGHPSVHYLPLEDVYEGRITPYIGSSFKAGPDTWGW